MVDINPLASQRTRGRFVFLSQSATAEHPIPKWKEVGITRNSKRNGSTWFNSSTNRRQISCSLGLRMIEVQHSTRFMGKNGKVSVGSRPRLYSFAQKLDKPANTLTTPCCPALCARSSLCKNQAERHCLSVICYAPQRRLY